MKALEEMTVYELRERKAEVVSELRAVLARLRELENFELFGPDGDARSMPIVAPRPNAHVEGAEATQDDGA